MTNLYAEWKKLRDDVQNASARLYYEKNENTERKYEEALEMLVQFEKENGIPLMAEEAKVKKMFCPQTNEEWLDRKSTKEKAEWLFKLMYKCYWCGREYTPRSLSLYNEKECPFKKCMKDKKDFEKWLKQPHNNEVEK